MLFVWEKYPPPAFCMGEVSSACFLCVRELWGKCVLRLRSACFLYGRWE